MSFENTIDLGRSRGLDADGLGINTSVLSLGISALAPAGVDVDELLVVFGMFTHIINHASSNLVVFILVAVDLIGKGVEETITCFRPTKRTIRHGCLEKVDDGEE